MKIITVVFSLVIMAWALLNALLIFGSSHSFESIEWKYKYTVITSLIIFPITGIHLYRVFILNRKTIGLYILTTISLILTGLLISYYGFDLSFESDNGTDELSILEIIPLGILAVTGFFIIATILKAIKQF